MISRHAVRSITSLTVLSSFTVLAARAPAQCGNDWLKGPLAHAVDNGTNGTVYAGIPWDPDGPGPQPPRLAIGGTFTSAGGVLTQRIAEWSGSEWAPLGSGMPQSVWALTVFQDDLIAGGNFASAGGIQASRIARWDGSSWHSVGGGLNDTVSTLIVYNDDLIAGGWFTVAGGATVAAPYIARWDGSQWHSMDAPFTGPIVGAMAVHSGELYVAGSYTAFGAQLARWNGSTWSLAGGGAGPVWSGPNVGTIHALASINGELFAGGWFDSISGSPVNNIARWNGVSWQNLGGGVNAGVSAIHSFQGLLVAAGQFTQAGTVPASHAAAWTGSAWVPLSTGLTLGFPNTVVDMLAEFDGELIAGGIFSSAGGQPANHIARWNGSAWAPFAWPDPAVYATAPLGNRMIAAGSFLQPTASSTTDARHIVAWDGVHLAELSSGMNAPVRALTSFIHPGPFADRELVAGGEFTSAGGVAVGRVARWVENPLLAFPPPAWEPMGAGFNSTVYAIERFNGSTIAAGTFTASGTTTVNRIARWNGAAWAPLGAGLNNTVYALRYGAVTPNSIELLVGGNFTTAGGSPADRIARWVVNPLLPPGPGNGSWAPMGTGFNATVRAIERHNGATYAAGDFTASGAAPVNHVARWTGSAWVALGTGLDGPVNDLHSSGGFLYAAGSFTTAGGVQCRRVARWDGTAWAEVSNGADGPAFAMATFHDEVHVGGTFEKVRDSIESPAWGRYLQSGQVWIAHHPQSASRPCGANFAPDVQPAAGYTGLAYQWRKDGSPLVNGPTGTGSTVVGANGNFALLDAGFDDEGVYDCVITNCGGPVTSNGATLTVTAYADCNADRQFTVADFGCFQGKYVLGDPYADCNQSGTLTVADFGCFQTKFVAGCP